MATSLLTSFACSQHRYMNTILRNVKRFKSKYKKSYMIDKMRIYARGGAGGQGCASRGGMGGDGGDVIVKVEKCSLSDLAKKEVKRFIAGNGQNSRSYQVNGKQGKSLVLRVPPGTTIVDASGTNQLYDLDKVGSQITLAKGGHGGYAETPSWAGSKGGGVTVSLILKLIADIGMVGFPNAGKSTLLGALSNASPKVADYPFTTVRPDLGHMNIVQQDDTLHQFTVADLPGLVEGAHENAGMGHRFLRHIERTRALLFVVDVSGFQLSLKTPHRTAFDAVKILASELDLYLPGLSKRPSILAVNKMDKESSDSDFSTFCDELEENKDTLYVPQFLQIVPISAKNGSNVDQLKKALSRVLLEQDTTMPSSNCAVNESQVQNN